MELHRKKKDMREDKWQGHRFDFQTELVCCSGQCKSFSINRTEWLGNSAKFKSSTNNSHSICQRNHCHHGSRPHYLDALYVSLFTKASMKFLLWHRKKPQGQASSSSFVGVPYAVTPSPTSTWPQHVSFWVVLIIPNTWTPWDQRSWKWFKMLFENLPPCLQKWYAFRNRTLKLTALDFSSEWVEAPLQNPFPMMHTGEQLLRLASCSRALENWGRLYTS